MFKFIYFVHDIWKVYDEYLPNIMGGKTMQAFQKSFIF
jgi:hypothetical protein